MGLSDRILKFLGTNSIGTSYTGSAASGTITNAALTTYGTTPWVAVLNASLANPTERPNFSFSGDTLTWTFSGSTRPNTTFVWGIF
jgi:hypothetical protein